MIGIKESIGFVGLGLAVAIAGVIIAKDSCVSEVKQETVRGNSLSGVVENGQSVKVQVGYYNCHSARRNDIVIYKYAGSADPLIKIVKGLPGDKFGLEQAEGGWHIRLNGKRLANSLGEPYRLADAQTRVLALYEKDYHGVIPPGAYLLMGNLANGSLDSTHFGLVSQHDLEGKVVKVIK